MPARRVVFQLFAWEHLADIEEAKQYETPQPSAQSVGESSLQLSRDFVDDNPLRVFFRMPAALSIMRL
jgi:hypothetical protein